MITDDGITVEQSITFTPASRDSLRRCYDVNLEEGKQTNDTIVWRGHQLVMGYVKYLLQYLDGKFT